MRYKIDGILQPSIVDLLWQIPVGKTRALHRSASQVKSAASRLKRNTGLRFQCSVSGPNLVYVTRLTAGAEK